MKHLQPSYNNCYSHIQIDSSQNGKITSLAKSDGRAIIHWLAAGMEHPFALNKPDKNGEWGVVNGLLENNDYPLGQKLQLERIGFARLESSEMIWTHS